MEFLLFKLLAGKSLFSSRITRYVFLLVAFLALSFILGSCKKTVSVVWIELDKSSLALTQGDTVRLVATVLPVDATEKKVVWSSNNNAVASVDGNGSVVAISPGIATVTVITLDGGKSASCSVTVSEPIVNIPDANFKAYVLLHFDKDNDGSLSYSEAAIPDIINCNSMNITSLEGIEHFTSLIYLACYNNKLSSLDVSNNHSLGTLVCNNNRLGVLVLNASLSYLDCSYNQIIGIDVSKNTALKNFYCQYNRLGTLDASTMTEPYTFMLGCGNQKDERNAPVTLKLTLSFAQKSRWESLKILLNNANVSVTYK